MADSREPKNKNGASRSGGSGLPSRRSIHHSNSGESGNTGKRTGQGDKSKRTSAGATAKSAKQGKKPKNKKKRSLGRKIGLGVLIAILVAIILGSIGFIVAYATTKVPQPGEFALAQKTTVYYADGESELGTFSEIDRTIIDTEDV
ncbi:MAG TPA: penicillin-binding protein, partial [Actinomyces sp.]|nr:penicillin-binding protein [Actinomyces sp.]